LRFFSFMLLIKSELFILWLVDVILTSGSIGCLYRLWLAQLSNQLIRQQEPIVVSGAVEGTGALQQKQLPFPQKLHLNFFCL
jgi:hypothetical protein